MSIDDDVASLYQLPLSEFTAARDALAKTAGATGPLIKKLTKPNAAAWAVNQVYWKRRAVFDKLATATDRLRAAEVKRLGGKSADIDLAQAAHRAALTTAVDAARDLLTSSGDAASPATMTAVRETFESLPWSEPSGRLTKPVRPSGFGALAGLLSGATIAPARQAEVISITERAAQQPSVAEARRAADAEKKKERAIVEKDLRRAKDDERETTSAFAQAKRALEKAERERDRLEQEFEAARARVQELRSGANEAAARQRAATGERERLEGRLKALGDD
jgi:hypothetical protein